MRSSWPYCPWKSAKFKRKILYILLMVKFVSLLSEIRSQGIVTTAQARIAAFRGSQSSGPSSSSSNSDPTGPLGPLGILPMGPLRKLLSSPSPAPTAPAPPAAAGQSIAVESIEGKTSSFVPPPPVTLTGTNADRLKAISNVGFQITPGQWAALTQSEKKNLVQGSGPGFGASRQAVLRMSPSGQEIAVYSPNKYLKGKIAIASS